LSNDEVDLSLPKQNTIEQITKGDNFYTTSRKSPLYTQFYPPR